MILQEEESPNEDDQQQKKLQNEKIIRCRKFEAGLDGYIPNNYKHNSNKEMIILKHLKKYKEQFQLSYSKRDIFLFPLNEAN